MPFFALTGRATHTAKSCRHPRAGAFQYRQQAKQKTRNKVGAEGEAQRWQIDREFVQAWQILGANPDEEPQHWFLTGIMERFPGLRRFRQTRGGEMQGPDKFAIQIPASMANGNYSIAASVNGVQAPSGIRLTVHQ